MKEFFQNINNEFQKIVWPTGKELKAYATQVFAFMALFTLFFWGIDALITRGIYEIAAPESAFQDIFDLPNDQWETLDLNDSNNDVEAENDVYNDNEVANDNDE